MRFDKLRRTAKSRDLAEMERTIRQRGLRRDDMVCIVRCPLVRMPGMDATSICTECRRTVYISTAVLAFATRISHKGTIICNECLAKQGFNESGHGLFDPAH